MVDGADLVVIIMIFLPRFYKEAEIPDVQTSFLCEAAEIQSGYTYVWKMHHKIENSKNQRNAIGYCMR